MLRYYNVKEAVSLQCDASQSGLGAALLQGGQPVAYASCALTSAESQYAQVEKRCCQLYLHASTLRHTYLALHRLMNDIRSI